MDIDVQPLSYQELNHLDLVGLNRVVQGRLTIVINKIVVASVTDEDLNGCNLALSASIENWALAIVIDLIRVAAVLDQPLHQLVLAFSRGVVESCLLQGIWLTWRDAHILKDFPHLY